MAVVVIGATHASPMETDHPVIGGYDDLEVIAADGTLQLAIRDSEPAAADRLAAE
jgi:hypothetical protein